MYKWVGLALALWFSAEEGLLHAEGGLIARVGQSGEFLELEQSNGQVIKDYLPLYRAGGVRYFSVGVGLEERQAQYPPFSLKLVFTAGGKPYLAGVDVTIQPAKGAAAITISREQVEGPWLFVDLPPGTYDISATYGQHKQALEGIKVVGGKQKTVHLRWAEDTGPTVKAPNE
ncbi:MAG TPA: carboxypeptidase-like regulatory domain-containing protein [Nitrospira sp.]|nr:carboxypeptidase-like regulatory domain-containing protein [Nitrospira sp.]